MIHILDIDVLIVIRQIFHNPRLLTPGIIPSLLGFSAHYLVAKSIRF